MRTILKLSGVAFVMLLTSASFLLVSKQTIMDIVPVKSLVAIPFQTENVPIRQAVIQKPVKPSALEFLSLAFSFLKVIIAASKQAAPGLLNF